MFRGTPPEASLAPHDLWIEHTNRRSCTAPAPRGTMTSVHSVTGHTNAAPGS
jgi:hypothetical protein